MGSGPNSQQVRIAGVPEHFNVPWRLAVEEALFDSLDVEVEWVDEPSGTGAIMRGLADGTYDLATPLTEGAITAIANGNLSRIVSTWVTTPLLWGIHVAATGDLTEVADLAGRPVAISRMGSGSELMTRVLYDQQGWDIDEDAWRIIDNLDGALTALPAGEADVFLWNKSMTQPHVDDGTFRRVGVLPTPWPSFVVAVGERLRAEAGLAQSICQIAIARAAGLRMDHGAVPLIAERYDLEIDGAAEWFDQARWATDVGVDESMVADVAATMQRLGRIGSTPSPTALIV